ncbi:MAG: hypothetical protein ABIM89_04460, partial [Mycobacteriales bacterium]
ASVGTVTGPPAQTVTVPLLAAPPRPLQADHRATPPAAGTRDERALVPTGGFAPPLGGGGAPASPATQIRDALAQLVSTAQAAAAAAAEAAPTAAKGGALGLAALPFLLFFLLIQKRLDERDPKLALAPSHETEFLKFDDDFPPIDRRIA